MKPGLIYRVGINGCVDKSMIFSTPEEAIGMAYRLWNKGGKSVSVYGYCEDYSCGSTQFWRHWKISKTGAIQNK